MKYFILSLSFLAVLASCDNNTKPPKSIENNSFWVGELIVDSANSVRFNFSVNTADKDSSFISIFNGEEELVQKLTLRNDSLFFSFPVFDSWFDIYLENDSLMSGKMEIPSKKRAMDFIAKKTDSKLERGYGVHTNSQIFNGKWKVSFADGGDYSDAIGVFNITEKNAAGTFLTETGDYRYLQGSTKDDSLFLSCFDGAHVFLFKAKYHEKDSISGVFYSGNTYMDTWSGVKNNEFELRKADTLTRYIGDSTKLTFNFPDVDGVDYFFPNPMEHSGNITLIQLMGTWCPNCKDEIVYYQELLEKHDDITVIGLCFEYPETFDGKRERVQHLKEKYNIEYPLLIAGNANKAETSAIMTQLNHVVSYPTTIIVDKAGKVRRIHTGFYGPGTGSYYEEYKKEMEAFLESLR